MGGVMLDAELASDHLRDAGERPDIAFKAERLSAAQQRVEQAGALLGRKLGLRASPLARTQGFLPALARSLQPHADRAFRHAQRLGDLTLQPALVLQLPRAPPPLFQPRLSMLCRCSAHLDPLGAEQGALHVRWQESVTY